MKHFLLPFAAILIAIWGIGFFGFQWPGGVHVLLVLALMATLLRTMANPAADSSNSLFK